jgi:hypothetical protein
LFNSYSFLFTRFFFLFFLSAFFFFFFILFPSKRSRTRRARPREARRSEQPSAGAAG